MKEFPKCDKTKPLDAFYDRKENKCGKEADCKACRNTAIKRNTKQRKKLKLVKT